MNSKPDREDQPESSDDLIDGKALHDCPPPCPCLILVPHPPRVEGCVGGVSAAKAPSTFYAWIVCVCGWLFGGTGGGGFDAPSIPGCRSLFAPPA